jgi:leucyl aminopeptidase (aminopeptidase T)
MIGKIKNPIRIEIKNGKIISIKGKEEAEVFKKILEEFGENSKIIAEFAIGLNPKAEIIGNITVDEKSLGTIHIAFGNSAGIGGNNEIPIHLDCVIKSPNVWIDNNLIIDNGKIVE